MVAAAPSMAGTFTFSRSFTAPGSFSDVYNLSIEDSYAGGAAVFEVDNSLLLNIDISSVSLVGSGFAAFGGSALAFGGINSGNYTLTVNGLVSNAWNLPTRISPNGNVGYTGFLQTFFGDISETPASVPEPATLLLLGAGMIGVAAAARRRKSL
jgi:hypothetical protein